MHGILWCLHCNNVSEETASLKMSMFWDELKSGSVIGVPSISWSFPILFGVQFARQLQNDWSYFQNKQNKTKQKSWRNREEKSLRHVAMVVQFLGLNKTLSPANMEATAIIAVASFFVEEAKSINRGRNHYNPFYTFWVIWIFNKEFKMSLRRQQRQRQQERLKNLNGLRLTKQQFYTLSTRF